MAVDFIESYITQFSCKWIKTAKGTRNIQTICPNQSQWYNRKNVTYIEINSDILLAVKYQTRLSHIFFCPAVAFSTFKMACLAYKSLDSTASILQKSWSIL